VSLSKHAACSMVSRLYSLECCTLATGSEVRKNVKRLRGEMLTSPRRTRDLKYLEMIMAGCVTLDLHACLPHVEKSGQVSRASRQYQQMLGRGAQSQGLRKSRVHTQVYHWGPDGLRHVPWIFWTPYLMLKGRRNARLHHLQLPFQHRSLGWEFPSFGKPQGFTLTKQRRKHLKKMWSLKELWSCLLKTSRAQDISKSHVFAFV